MKRISSAVASFSATFGLSVLASISATHADTFQLNLSDDGDDALSPEESILSAAHVNDALAETVNNWNNYSVGAPGEGVLTLDTSDSSNNTLVEGTSGVETSVSFRYAEGTTDVDFSLGFTSPGTGPEDTGNPGDSGPEGTHLYTDIWFTRPGDGAMAFQFRDLPEGLYNVYVYAQESNNTNRSYDVTFQTDSDDISSLGDGVSNGISTGNDADAFVDGLNYTKQLVNVGEEENLVVFIAAEQDGAETFSSVGAIQIVEVPFIDTDNDNLPDEYENNNGLVVGIDDSGDDMDADGGPDGLTNLQEFQLGTDPQDSDTDDDGINDGDEVDGTFNPYQTNVSGDTPTAAPGLATSPLSKDSDGDGILDNEEIVEGDDGFITNPNTPDTDGDELPDLFEATDRGNGTLDPTDPNGENAADGDPDEDDLFNEEELELGTDPRNADTDDDGYTDDVESNDGIFEDLFATGTDPLNPDTDGDTLLDGDERFDFGSSTEAPYNSDPNEPDTDFDGFNDNIEILGNSDPDDDTSTPSFDPVETAVQFDIQAVPGGRGFQGTYAPVLDEDTIFTPAHTSGLLGETDNTFNGVSDNSAGAFFSPSGTPVPSIGIDLGTATDDGGGTLTFEFDTQLESTGETSNLDIYGTDLWGDYLFTRDDINLVARVNGLVSGDYLVLASLRQVNAPERTFAVSFGTQAPDGATDPVLGTPIEGIEGAPETFQSGQNFFAQRVTLTEDNQYIVLMVDPTNERFAQLNALQIIPAPESTGADVEITGITVANPPETATIEFEGESATFYTLKFSDDLTAFENPEGGPVTSLSGANGTGQFVVPIDLATNPKQFFQIEE